MKKKNRFRKIISISMAAAMTMSLAACGENTEDKQDAVKSADGALGAYEETFLHCGQKHHCQPQVSRRRYL